MAPLADKVAAEHRPFGDGTWFECGKCVAEGVWLPNSLTPNEGKVQLPGWTRHIAEVTEAAVRAEVARSILAEVPAEHTYHGGTFGGLQRAAEIARGRHDERPGQA